MKRITKHFMAMLLSLVMVMTMGLTVFAAEEEAGSTSGSRTETQVTESNTNNNTSNTSSTTYKLTLKGTATGHTYEAYQIFTGDLSKKEDGTKVLSNVAWGTGVTYNGTESAADVAKALGDGTMTIAQLEDKLTLTTLKKTVPSAKDNTVIDDLAAGYYLVKDEDHTQEGKSDAYTKFIVQVVGNTEADIKSGVPTVEKKVKDTNDSTGITSDWQDSADADFNDEVEYKITGTLPDSYEYYTKYSYIFTDTMSKGLTYTASTDAKKSFTVTLYKDSNDAEGTDITSHFNENISNYTGDDQVYAGGKVITWTENDTNGLKDISDVTKSSKIVVTYKAKLNDDAKIGSAGNPNKVDLTFSNNPNKDHEGENGKTPEDKNIVFTYKTIVNKVDQDKKSLPGAAFTLQKKIKQANGTTEYEDVKTIGPKDEKNNDITTFTFTGLDDGDYKLIESMTPAGYNTISPIEFRISADHDVSSDDPTLISLTGTDITPGVANEKKATFTPSLKDENDGSLTTDVINKKGSTLPSTGGRGTTMIYIIGAALVVTAGVVLVMRKKMNSDK
jgi:fimbrial isopeptide formation D2 family protein/LPXTG-motif cell wall-anchored protein